METVILTKGESFKDQEEICEAFARANGLNVIGYISDLEELEKYPECKAVLVAKRDRISRNHFDAQLVELKLREKKIKLISADGDTGRSSLLESKFLDQLAREINGE